MRDVWDKYLVDSTSEAVPTTLAYPPSLFSREARYLAASTVFICIQDENMLILDYSGVVIVYYKYLLYGVVKE